MRKMLAPHDAEASLQGRFRASIAPVRLFQYPHTKPSSSTQSSDSSASCPRLLISKPSWHRKPTSALTTMLFSGSMSSSALAFGSRSSVSAIRLLSLLNFCVSLTWQPIQSLNPHPSISWSNSDVWCVRQVNVAGVKHIEHQRWSCC